MNDGLGVRVAYTGMWRQWRDSGGDVWLQVESPDVETALVEEVVGAANATVATAGLEVLGSFVAPLNSGWSIGVVDAEGWPSVEAWVEALVAELSRTGVTAVIKGVPNARLPEILSPGQPAVPTVFAFWTLDWPTMAEDPDRDGHWFVPPESTAGLARAASAFAHQVPGRTRLTQGVYSMTADPAAVEEGLARGVRLARTSGVDVLPDDRTCRHVAWCVPGHSVAQVVSDSDWISKLAELKALMTAMAGAGAVAFVRAAPPGALSVQAIASSVPLPGIHEADVRYHPHLLDRFTPDAHGIQVLTDAHLERARDLTAWTVTPLDRGRHLVETADLAPWYAAPVPEPDVLAQAREDFGPMLLTNEAIAANPPPW